MRSSDVWLGIPYDVFNFSMLSHKVCCFFNSDGKPVEPGTLYLTAASSHLYAYNFKEAAACITAEIIDQPQTPEALFMDGRVFAEWMQNLRDTKPGDPLRWWEVIDAPNT